MSDANRPRRQACRGPPRPRHRRAPRGPPRAARAAGRHPAARRSDRALPPAAPRRPTCRWLARQGRPPRGCVSSVGSATRDRPRSQHSVLAVAMPDRRPVKLPGPCPRRWPRCRPWWRPLRPGPGRGATGAACHGRAPPRARRPPRALLRRRWRRPLRGASRSRWRGASGVLSRPGTGALEIPLVAGRGTQHDLARLIRHVVGRIGPRRPRVSHQGTPRTRCGARGDPGLPPRPGGRPTPRG